MHEFTIWETNIGNFEIDNSKDKIFVNTFSDKNLLELTLENDEVYMMYKSLLFNDYILYYHNEQKSKFCKRKLFQHLWTRDDLNYDDGIFYSIEEPKDNKISNSQEKMLVIFDCMPVQEDYYSDILSRRIYHKYFENISKSLVKDVTIMRIIDLNLSHGSHYVKTINYPSMEDDIQRVIKKEMEERNISKSDVVLYGASKGGTGAILHASIGDYKCLATDPILDLHEYNYKQKVRDLHFLEDFRKENIVDEVNQYLQKGSFKKVIIGSENVPFNYERINQLNAETLVKLNFKYEQITKHAEISRNTVAEQLAILNGLLSEELESVFDS